MKRPLSLKREALTALTTDELAGLGAGGTLPATLVAKECLGTTQDSRVVCSDGCTMYGSACHC